MKTLIAGYGRSGKAVEALIAAQGGECTVLDGVGMIVASPGIRVVSELEFGVGVLRERGVKMLAVTGSKGKSSVVKLLAEALTMAGHPAQACGNYGLPVSALANSPSLPEWAVVEVSSFQLETTNLPPDTFRAAAVLNLQEDHLDRHGSVAVYHALKRKLLAMAEISVDMSASPVQLRRLFPDIDGFAPLFAGSYFDNEILATNALAACLLLEAAGIDRDGMARAFAAFKPLPHRMNLVGEYDQVRYIDDSKATSLAALAAAVKMTPAPIRLIAGGLPKGDDPESVARLLTNRVKKVYLIGQSAESFAAAWEASVECEISRTLEAAVAAVKRDAKPGETVLLSPGTASFDQFKNFEERGEVFASLVKQEG